MNPIESLANLFERFPGIGPRQARRFVQYLLATNPSVRAELAEYIRALGSTTAQCKECFRWFVRTASKADACSICSNTRRDRTILFIVEKDADIENVERSGFKGVYFVLGGTIALASEEPEKHIRLRELLRRVEQKASELSITHSNLQEVILGLSATSEGDHTRLILQEKLLPIAQGLNFKISSLGRGLSTGSELEYADPDTIESALNSRG
ncbi:MAG: toprim domain-containing protein [bacterium]